MLSPFRNARSVNSPGAARRAPARCRSVSRCCREPSGGRRRTRQSERTRCTHTLPPWQCTSTTSSRVYERGLSMGSTSTWTARVSSSSSRRWWWRRRSRLVDDGTVAVNHAAVHGSVRLHRPGVRASAARAKDAAYYVHRSAAGEADDGHAARLRHNGRDDGSHRFLLCRLSRGGGSCVPPASAATFTQSGTAASRQSELRSTRLRLCRRAAVSPHAFATQWGRA